MAEAMSTSLFFEWGEYFVLKAEAEKDAVDNARRDAQGR